VSIIERIEMSRHRLPLDPHFAAAWDHRPRQAFEVTVIRVYDDEGRMGFGVGDAMAGVVDHLHLFVGHDPTDLDRHGAVLSNIAFHDGRPWPLDTALWDLTGKIRSEPIWQMVGGGTNRIRLYASWGVHRSPAEAAEQGRATVAAGFEALKLRFGRPAGIEADFEVLEAVIDAVDDDVAVMVDCNQGWRMPWDTQEPWTFATALAVAIRLAEHGVTWMEEPLHRGDHSGMAALRSESGMTIAGGEMTRELHEFDLMLAAGCLDVYQPDVVVTGGMGGLAALARRVAEDGKIFSPHTWGSGVALLANAHLTAGTVSAPYLEFPWDPPEWTPDRRDFILSEPIAMNNGWLELGLAPGLGAHLDEERLSATVQEGAHIELVRSGPRPRSLAAADE
jgi:L-alanine-DL-glutamate epimerase-like enolase superfamily enzyme